jgi:chorismate dehydratase
MTPVRLGAVGYLNARPLVFGLDRSPRFDLRYDLPSECARLLHAGDIDLGLIPSIEYLRGPRTYGIVPHVAITSRGPVSSVALYTRRGPKDIRSIAMDSSSRTSVALATVLMHRVWGLRPRHMEAAPDLERMLAAADAALLIGDLALTIDHESLGLQKIDLGELWTSTTGLPFVYAFWAGRPHAVTQEDVRTLVLARDQGVVSADAIAREYFRAEPRWQSMGERYLRDNIKYDFGGEEIAGLQAFYRYSAELDLVTFDGETRWYAD